MIIQIGITLVKQQEELEKSNESIQLLEDNEDLNKIFGEKFIKTLVAMRKVEYHAYMEVVSPWEREYLLLNV